MSTGTVQMFQTAASIIEHVRAARWCVGSGQSISASRMAAIERGGKLREVAMGVARNHHPHSSIDAIKQARINSKG